MSWHVRLGSRQRTSLLSLVAGGSSAPALHWLVQAGYALHLAAGSRRRKPRDPKSAFDERSRFLLTDEGLALARAAKAEKRRVGQSASHGPHWDGEALELWLGDFLVRRVSPRAINLIPILVAFEEEGWPTVIDDPLPGGSDDAPKRLHNAINGLNSHHFLPLLRFHSNGRGDGIRWELEPEQVPVSVTRKRKGK